MTRYPHNCRLVSSKLSSLSLSLPLGTIVDLSTNTVTRTSIVQVRTNTTTLTSILQLNHVNLDARLRCDSLALQR